MTITIKDINSWNADLKDVGGKFSQGINTTVKLFKRKDEQFKRLADIKKAEDFIKAAEGLQKSIKIGLRMMQYYENHGLPVLIDTLEGLLFELNLRKDRRIKESLLPLLNALKYSKGRIKKIKKILSSQFGEMRTTIIVSKRNSEIYLPYSRNARIKKLINNERIELDKLFKKFEPVNTEKLKPYVAELRSEVQKILKQRRNRKLTAAGMVGVSGAGATMLGYFCKVMFSGLEGSTDPNEAAFAALSVIITMTVVGGAILKSIEQAADLLWTE